MPHTKFLYIPYTQEDFFSPIHSHHLKTPQHPELLFLSNHDVPSSSCFSHWYWNYSNKTNPRQTRSILTLPPDWANFGLGNQPTVNGHVESRYHASTKTWSPPQFIADPHIRVHGLCPGLNYGQQVYEGLKAFRSSGPGRHDRITVFRPDYHAARLAHSAAFVSLPAPPAALFRACVRLAVVRNAEFVPPAPTTAGFLYVRPLLFGAGPQLLLAPPDEVVFAVYVAPAGAPYHGGGARGLDALVCEEFDRAAPRGTGSAKVGGNYAPVWRHQARAKELGYGITLHLDSKTGGFVEEFSTSGFLGVSVEEGGRTRVLHVPRTENAIRSATSDSIVRLAQREGWTVRREEVSVCS